MSSAPSPKLTRRRSTCRVDIVRFVTETGQQPIGSLDQRAGHPAELLVGGVADPAAAPMLEQLGQRVLQQRQRAGAIDDLPHQLGHERRLERDAVLFHRAGDRALQLERAHRGDDFGAVAEQLTETAVLQWTVVEVGAQRGDDADPTLVVGDGAHQADEEAIRRRRVDLGEQLLELVDHEQQLRAVVRQHAVERALQPVLARQLLEQRGRRIDGDAEQRILELPRTDGGQGSSRS